MQQKARLSLVTVSLYTAFFLVIGRLFYWQVIKNDALSAIASDQYQRSFSIRGSRGAILTANGHVLVGNQQVYRLFAEPPLLDKSSQEIADLVVESLGEDLRSITRASESAELNPIVEAEKSRVKDRIESRKDKSWVGLYNQLDEKQKNAIEQLEITGLGFEPYEIRMYPEASMSAHITGFVGKDESGLDIGYFGIEGALEKELQPRSEVQRWEQNLLGFTQEDSNRSYSLDGRDVYLTIERPIQSLAERELQRALDRYGAVSGEIIILEPKTGAVLASASLPSYYQPAFFEFDQSIYKNPVVTHLFEPGSIFKPITVAAGIESGSISPETKCDICDKPFEISKYSIKTWNNEYNPNITMTDALAKSDNVAMVFIQQKTNKDTFVETIQRFGFGQSTTPDLQEDIVTPFPKKLGPVELATISFGQGISTNSLQMTKAIAAIANDGVLMEPHFIDQVVDHTTGENILTKPKELGRAVSAQTAEQVTAMMVAAAETGEAQWTASADYTVAGKTGTAQIAVDGRYDPNKTIASFVGFSPASDPKYVMLVKLVEPQSSPWAAETAAPTWYRVAEELNWLLGVTPDK